ncbi:ribonuclease HII [archaeon]|nr:ribonuclease HII [archaeon]
MGPLLISGVLIEEKDLGKLEEIGVDDSKKLKPEERENLFDRIKKIAKDFEIIKIEPGEVDRAVFGEKGLNLNWLEAEKTIKIINKLKPDKTIIDCPSVNIEAYRNYILEDLKDKSIELVVMHKADAENVVVGAASILAKVTRDREIEKLKKKYGDFGSGYPSQEKTQKYLKDNWNKHPEIFRKSWSSWKNVQKKEEQKNLDNF